MLLLKPLVLAAEILLALIFNFPFLLLETIHTHVIKTEIIFKFKLYIFILSYILLIKYKDFI